MPFPLYSNCVYLEVWRPFKALYALVHILWHVGSKIICSDSFQPGSQGQKCVSNKECDLMHY